MRFRVRHVEVDAAGVGMTANNAFGAWSCRHDGAVSHINPHPALVRRKIAGTVATGKNPAGRITRVSGPRRLDATAPDIDGDVPLTMVYLIRAMTRMNARSFSNRTSTMVAISLRRVIMQSASVDAANS